MRKIKLLLSGLLLASLLQAQETFPVNGVADKREHCYAFTNATIVKDAQTTLSNATMVIRDGKITEVGEKVIVPQGAQVIDASGKFLMPGIIDCHSHIAADAINERAARGCASSTAGAVWSCAPLGGGPLGWRAWAPTSEIRPARIAPSRGRKTMA